LGGKDAAGIGFAIGLDRVVELLKEINPVDYHYTDVFILVFDKENLPYTFNLVEDLRSAGYVAEYDYNIASMKSQMKKADKSKARYAVILGSNEVKENKVSVKDLVSGEQSLIELANVFEYLKNKLI
ncbi:MAG: histidine--tRNA ligase, partial [Mucispirillum sp.]|nr:histidine--tRNA ligase [Mucispirillum sp.]